MNLAAFNHPKPAPSRIRAEIAIALGRLAASKVYTISNEQIDVYVDILGQLDHSVEAISRAMLRVFPGRTGFPSVAEILVIEKEISREISDQRQKEDRSTTIPTIIRPQVDAWFAKMKCAIGVKK